eukprot:5709848-Pleurochrysis_carterae.AAC.1
MARSRGLLRTHLPIKLDRVLRAKRRLGVRRNGSSGTDRRDEALLTKLSAMSSDGEGRSTHFDGTARHAV